MSTIGSSLGTKTAPARPPAAPDVGTGPQRCLPGQRRTWLLDRMDPGNPALHVAARWRMEGRFPGARLDRACARLVERYPALRTGIVDEDGEPVQVVESWLPFRVPEVDLTGLAEADALAEADRIAQQEARTPFDLSAPPLLRVTRVRVREDVSIVLLTAHRLVCDAGGIGALAREMGADCAATAEDQPPAPSGVGSAGAAAPRDEGLRLRDETHWQNALQGLRPFALPADRARPPVQTSNSAIFSLPLERDLLAGLREVSRRHGATLYMTTLATLFALLHRYSGERDIAIGSELSGDDAGELRGPAGPAGGTVVLRALFADTPAFADLLAQVRNTVGASLKHAGTPLDRVIELLAPERDLSRHALFSIHFTLQAVPGDARYGALRLVELPPCSAGSLYDLDFCIAERDGWHVSCEYNTDLFEPQTVARLLGHLVNLLRAVAADPAQPIATMPLLGTDERRALTVDCNRSEADYPQHLTLPRLFQDQVGRTPDAIAIACGERQLTYRELDRAANRLAHELQGRGIARFSRVAICLDRSPEMVVALLGVLKAGAAYVPLDPAYPAARLAQIVGDAQPAAVLTTRVLCGRLPAGNAPTLVVDADAHVHDRVRDSAPPASPSPDEAAYVIYTSGSTGRPKGVQIPHRALTNLLWSMRSRPGITAADTLVAVTTVSFDIAALELFLPLIVGARVVIARDGEAGDGGALLQLLRRHRATILQATPVTWQILLASGWRADPSVKMLCGGEALPRPLAEALLEHGGELWNLYGPTETTIWSSALRVERGGGPVLLGPPIANTQFYVLDAAGELVPDGVPGELSIGGDGVATGYVNLPELTRERFVPDRFRPQAGARLYRTGDRVRRRPCGELEFLGRGDHQVKLRGLRIELGEIEAVLGAHAQVAQCVAIAAPDASGETALRAFVVARELAPGATHAAGAADRDNRSRDSALVDSLRASLRLALPAYMCPPVISVLAALPRTANGKIDRSALPMGTGTAGADPVGAAHGRDSDPIARMARASHKTTNAGAARDAPAPRTRTAAERRLTLLWSAVLGIGEVDVDANFFEVGGHSLLAVRLLARIEATFGQRLSLAALFGNPTIAGQARLLAHGDARAFDFRQVVQLQPAGARPPMLGINNTGIYYGLSKRLGADQPFTSLQLFDPVLPRAALPRTLQDIAAEYVQLIRRVQRRGPYALLGWCVAGTLAFEVARQLVASGQQVSRLILFDTLTPGHPRRLPWPRSMLADYAYRWQLIAADWARARRSEHRLATFLGNRTIVMKLLALVRPARDRGPSVGGPPGPDRGHGPLPHTRPLSAEEYDQWLLRYLEDAAASYEPGQYSGSMTLIRSSQEPAGRFIDPQMGWGAFVQGGIEVVVIEGDHFGIFQEPSVSRMAQAIQGNP